MNSQRKTSIIFTLICSLITTHIKTMEPQKISNRELLLFGTGALFGAGCVGLFCWYNNHQEQFKSLEDKMEKIQEEHHVLKKVVENQKQLLEEETTRIDQTRDWVIEDRDNRNDQQIIKAINDLEQRRELKKLKERVVALENPQEKFYSCHSSSSAE